MKITCISDIHGHSPELEGGDLLIIAGDLTATHSWAEFSAVCDWIDDMDYKKKIIVPGNHDGVIESLYLPELKEEKEEYFDRWDIDFLIDSGTEFVIYPKLSPTDHEKVYEREKVKIWGSPWTKRFKGMNPHCMAFTVDTEEELEEKWKLIPTDTDILVTHSPPWGIRDRTSDGQFVGSETLAYYVGSMENPPKLWVWGHIHESYGRDLTIRGKPYIMLNASHVNENYEPVNKPITIEL